MDRKEEMKRIEEEFGSHSGLVAHLTITLSMSEQPCDVTFFERGPALNVKIDPKISIALMYGAGAGKLKEMWGKIKFSNGEEASIEEIWTINPMPKNGFTDEELQTVDMAAA